MNEVEFKKKKEFLERILESARDFVLPKTPCKCLDIHMYGMKKNMAST